MPGDTYIRLGHADGDDEDKEEDWPGIDRRDDRYSAHSAAGVSHADDGQKSQRRGSMCVAASTRHNHHVVTLQHDAFQMATLDAESSESPSSSKSNEPLVKPSVAPRHPSSSWLSYISASSAALHEMFSGRQHINPSTSIHDDHSADKMEYDRVYHHNASLNQLDAASIDHQRLPRNIGGPTISNESESIPDASHHPSHRRLQSSESSPLIIFRLPINWLPRRYTSTPKSRALNRISSSLQSIWSKNSGPICIILSTIAYCGMGLSVKGIAMSDEHVPTLEIVVLRGVFGSAAGAFLVYYHGVDGGFWGPPKAQALLFLRGVLGFLALSFGFWALTIISVADSTILGFLSPVFTGIFGRIFLKEPWEVLDIAAGLVSLAGVLLIARPTFIFGHIFEPSPISGGANPVNPVQVFVPDSNYRVSKTRTGIRPALALAQIYSENGPNNHHNTASGTRSSVTSKSSNRHNVTLSSPRSNSVKKLPPILIPSGRVAQTSASGHTASPSDTENGPITVFASVNSDEMRIHGVISAVLSAIFVAAAYVVIRKLSKVAHAYHVVTYFHSVAIPLGLVASLILPEAIEPHPWIIPTNARTYILLLLTSVCGVIGQLLLSYGLARESAAKVANMTYIQAVFAFLGEWIFWGIVPHWMSIVGSAIVVSSVMTAAWFRNHRKQQVRDDGAVLSTETSPEYANTVVTPNVKSYSQIKHRDTSYMQIDDEHGSYGRSLAYTLMSPSEQDSP